MSSPNQPPQPNPVLTAYESFVNDTPLVTRYILTSLFSSYILSFFVDPGMAVANIPYFTVQKFELYRPILCNLVCEGILSLIFAYLSFVDMGKRMEYSLGSTAFSFLLLTLGGLANLSFLILCYLLYFLSGNSMELMRGAAGIWTILLALIAVECTQAPAGSKKRLFVVEVPVLYYPVALLTLFVLISGFRVHLVLSTGIGYLYGFGYLNSLKPAQTTFTRWEDGCLVNFTQRQGWVVGHAATGASAWLPVSQNGEAEGGGSWTPSSFFQGQPSNSRSTAAQSGGTVASPPAGGWGAASPGKVSKPSFPGGGQSLGSSITNRTPSTEGTTEARRVMREAAERRAEADMERDRND